MISWRSKLGYLLVPASLGIAAFGGGFGWLRHLIGP